MQDHAAGLKGSLGALLHATDLQQSMFDADLSHHRDAVTAVHAKHGIPQAVTAETIAAGQASLLAHRAAWLAMKSKLAAAIA